LPYKNLLCKDTGNDASSSVANSEFKLKLDECCGGQLPECLKNDICKLMNTFMQKSIGSTNLDVSLIGDALDEMRSTISRILNQFRSVDSAVQRLVLEVLELVHGFNNRAGNDDSIRLEVSKDTSAYDHHANTSAGQLFFPTCYQGHWFVFIVDIKDHCFVFLDSHYSSEDEFHSHVREMMVRSFAFHWNKYIKAEMPFDALKFCILICLSMAQIRCMTQVYMQ